MKRLTVIALSSAFIATPAFAEYDGVADKVGTVHVGIKAGFTNYVNSPTGVGIYGGYTIVGPNTFRGDFFSKISIAVEGEYADLGSTDYFYSDYKADAIGVSAAATYPINRQFSATAKAGVARTSDTFTSRTNPFFSYSNSYVGLHAGIAGQFHVNQQVGFFAAYDIYPNSYSMMSVGALFKFH